MKYYLFYLSSIFSNMFNIQYSIFNILQCYNDLTFVISQNTRLVFFIKTDISWG